MRPMRVRYAAPGWGVGELWLDGELVLHSDLPRPDGHPTVQHVRSGSSPTAVSRCLTPGQVPSGSSPRAPARCLTPGHALAGRLAAFFAGEGDDFADVELDLGDDPFYAACAEALRAVPRGEVVTYGELALLAGRPRAARAAGTFCARCNLSPFVPTHRVVAATGIGSYGSLGIGYKRRLLELEGVAL